MRTRRTLGAVVAAVAMLLSACGGGGSGASEDSPLRVAVAVEVSSLDPIKGAAGSDHVMLYPLYDTLISFNEELEPQPGLAESWEQPSPTELTLKLRSGVKFHDDTDMDAEAVKFNLDRARGEGSNVASDLSSVSNVRVDDPSTVTLEFSKPDASVLMALADRAGMIVSPAAAEAAGGDLSNAPSGTGGWTLDEWNRGSSLRYERNENYWDAETERVKNLQFNIVADPTTRLTSLQSGQQDIAIELSASDAESLEKGSGDVTLNQSPRLWFNHVYLNRTSEELSDPRVRRALNVAIDRETVLKSGYFGRGSVANGAMVSDYWAATPEDLIYDFDQDEARQLLDDAGASDLTFDMIVNADSATVRVGEILKQAWADVGVTVTLQPRETVQATTDYVEDKTAPALLSAFTGRPDPVMTYRLMFTEGGYFNASDESTPDVETAIDAANVDVETDERKPGLDEAAQAVYDDSSFLPLIFADNLIGLRSDVKGFTSNLLGKPKFIGVTRG